MEEQKQEEEEEKEEEVEEEEQEKQEEGEEKEDEEVEEQEKQEEEEQEEEQEEEEQEEEEQEEQEKQEEGEESCLRTVSGRVRVRDEGDGDGREAAAILPDAYHLHLVERVRTQAEQRQARVTRDHLRRASPISTHAPDHHKKQIINNKYTFT